MIGYLVNAAGVICGNDSSRGNPLWLPWAGTGAGPYRKVLMKNEVGASPHRTA